MTAIIVLLVVLIIVESFQVFQLWLLRIQLQELTEHSVTGGTDLLVIPDPRTSAERAREHVRDVMAHRRTVS